MQQTGCVDILAPGPDARSRGRTRRTDVRRSGPRRGWIGPRLGSTTCGAGIWGGILALCSQPMTLNRPGCEHLRAALLRGAPPFLVIRETRARSVHARLPSDDAKLGPHGSVGRVRAL